MGNGNSMGSQNNGGSPQMQTICGILNPNHQCNPNDVPCH